MLELGLFIIGGVVLYKFISKQIKTYKKVKRKVNKINRKIKMIQKLSQLGLSLSLMIPAILEVLM